jgi:hypothetical protein
VLKEGNGHGVYVFWQHGSRVDQAHALRDLCTHIAAQGLCGAYRWAWQEASSPQRVCREEGGRESMTSTKFWDEVARKVKEVERAKAEAAKLAETKRREKRFTRDGNVFILRRAAA